MFSFTEKRSKTHFRRSPSIYPISRSMIMIDMLNVWMETLCCLASQLSVVIVVSVGTWGGRRL